MEKKSRIINLIKALVVVVLAAAILFGIDKLFLLKSEDGINQMEAFYKQKDETVDVLFLGSSHVYCDIATGVLWDNYGMASFDLGGAEAPPWVSYYHLKEALRTQRPKVVCFEMSVPALYPTQYQSDSWAADNNYGMKIGRNRWDQLKVNSEEKDFRKRLFPLSVMHGRYADLNENDFKDVRNSINYKGFDPREYTASQEAPDMSAVTERVPCSEKAEEYIRKIIELCQSEDIPLIFFVSPFSVEKEYQEVFNYIFDIAAEYGVVCLDFDKMYDAMGLDFSADMADFTHLNYSGNYKFTDFFGRFLKENYDIPDRRGDERFASWDEDAYLQRVERNTYKFYLSQINPEEFFSAFSNDGYDIFVTIKTGTDNGLSDEAAGYYERIGIPKDKLISGNAFVIKDQKIIAELTEGFSYSITEGDNSLLFVEEGEGDYYHTVSLFANDDEDRQDYGNVVFIYDTVNNMYVTSVRL